MRVEDVNEVGDASRRERKPAEIGTVSAAGMLGHASNPTSAMQTGSYIRREEQKNFLSVALSRVESQGVNQHGGVSGARNGEGPDQVEILTELRKTVRERVELARNYRQTICFAVYIALYFWAVYAQVDTSRTFDVEQSLLNAYITPLTVRNEYKTKDDFYKWVRERLVPIFAGATCGNGKCEPPGEYAGVGRFGCEQDCGKQPNVSTVVVSLADPRTDASLLAYALDAGIEPTFTWNAFSLPPPLLSI